MDILKYQPLFSYLLMSEITSLLSFTLRESKEKIYKISAWSMNLSYNNRAVLNIIWREKNI